MGTRYVGVGVVSLVLAVAVMVAAPRQAHAIAACIGDSGWSPRQGSTVPTHARVLYWSDRTSPAAPKITATIAGKAVPVKVAMATSAPFTLWWVDVDSDRTGELVLAIEGNAVTSTYAVAAKAAAPATVGGSAFHFTDTIRHSSRSEIYDGLGIRLDAPVVAAHVKLRRDASAPWVELDVPAITVDAATSIDAQAGALQKQLDAQLPSLLVGQLGCANNYSAALFAGGVDLEITAILPNKATVAVKNLTHAKL